MTKNSAEKRAARQYQVDHPGTAYPVALRAVRREWQERHGAENVENKELSNERRDGH